MRSSSYRFAFYGHANILATHRSTLEITKDGSVTRKGDCVICVRADFDPKKLRGLAGRFVIEIQSDLSEREIVSFTANPGFCDARELVIRRSDFLSARTLGTRADKAACDLKLRFNQQKKFIAMIRPDEKAAE